MDRMDGGLAVFRSDSDFTPGFFYLTGIEEPGVLLLDPDSSSRVTLFLRPDNVTGRIWSGARLGLDGAKALPGLDAAQPLNQFETTFRRLLRNRSKAYCLFKDDELCELIRSSLRSADPESLPALIDIQPWIHHMRLIKDKAEIDCLRQAVGITTEALREVMKVAESVGTRAFMCNHWAEGGAGTEALAHHIVEVVDSGKAAFKPLYPDEMSLRDKVKTIATEIYG